MSVFNLALILGAITDIASCNTICDHVLLLQLHGCWFLFVHNFLFYFPLPICHALELPCMVVDFLFVSVFASIYFLS